MALLTANAAVAISNQAHLHGEHARTTAAASRGAGSRDDAAYAQDRASSGGMSGAALAAPASVPAEHSIPLSAG